jgi:hypothetical protein
VLTLIVETLSEGFARDGRVFATGKLEMIKTTLDSVAIHKAALMLPPLIQSVVDMSSQQLGDAFAKMLDTVDDRFFELAESAGTNVEQNFYFEAMRDIRIGRRATQRTFNQQIEHAFRLLCLGGEDSSNKTADPPLLLNEYVAEVDAVICRMSNKFKATSSVDLYKVTLRLDAISNEFAVNEKNNPLSHANVCLYFNAAIQSLGLDSKAKLLVLKLFDHFVMSRLAGLLIAVNDALAVAGILPDLNQEMSVSANEEIPGHVHAKKSGGAFLQLQQLMSVESTANSRLAPSDKRTELSKTELLSILSSLQRKTVSPTQQDTRQPLPDVKAHVLVLLNARQDQFLGSSLAQADDDIIQLVAMLINAILVDPYLPDQVKKSIRCLQIPLIKVGIMDYTLFGEREHVARNLVNELARIGVENHNKSAIAREVIYSKIDEVTQRIISDFDDDVSVFERELNDVLFFYKRAQTHLEHLENRAQLAEAGREKSELGRVVVQQSLMLLTKNQRIPPVVQRLLDEGWSNLLLLTLLQGGVEGDAWQDHILTAEALINSVQPGKDSAARRRSLSLVPQLLIKIREGLKKVQLGAFTISQILIDLEQAHLVALSVETLANSRKRSPATESSLLHQSVDAPLDTKRQQSPVLGDIATITQQIMHKSALRDTAPRSEPLETEAGAVTSAPVLQDLPVETPQSVSSSAQAEGWVDQLNLGVWFEVKNEEMGKKYRCKLVAHLEGYNKYIFVNRRGVKVMERSRSSLVNALVSGEMKIIQETQVFDRALQTVVNELRGTKGPTH